MAEENGDHFVGDIFLKWKWKYLALILTEVFTQGSN